MSGVSAKGRCQQASHELLPSRFAAQGYCWWNSRFLRDFIVTWYNYLRDLTSHNLAQVYGRLDRAGGLLRLRDFQTHVQLEAVVPDQAASATVFRQAHGQHQRWASFAHRQDYTPTLFADRLSRPIDRIEAFGTPGILHLHLWMGLTQFFRGFDVAEKGTDNHLNRLTMQGKLPAFAGFLQRITPRPW